MNNKLSLNFFGENVEIEIPKTLSDLRQQISEKFAFSPSDAAELILSYIKDFGEKIISTEKDFVDFLSNKVTTIKLDINQNSQIYQNSLLQLKNEAESDQKKLDDLLKKSSQLKAEKKEKIDAKKKDIEELNKKFQEISKKKRELIQSMDEELKKVKKQQIEMTKKLHQELKGQIKEENEINSSITELQKKLGLPITIKEKKLKPCIRKKAEGKKLKSTIKKKVKIEEPKKEQKEKKLFEGINELINKMVVKVNGLVNNQLSKENEKVELTEKQIHDSKIELKPEEEKKLFDIKKMGEEALTEMNKWTQFVLKHTEELTESISKKYEECKNLVLPVEKKIEGPKEIHYNYICDGCKAEPIQGIRYHCKQCQDFDFCEKCYESKKKEHGHEFTAIEKSVYPAPKEEHQDLAGKIIHYGVSCDGCGATPIVGCRYKCAVCKNFDYCEKCEETMTANHLHPFIKIYHPGMKIASIKCVVREDCPDYQSGH